MTSMIHDYKYDADCEVWKCVRCGVITNDPGGAVLLGDFPCMREQDE